MRIFAAVIFIFITILFVLGQVNGSANKDAAEKEELRRLYSELNEARTKRDRAALERIFADEFLYIPTTGNVLSKAENINQMLSKRDPIRPWPIPSFDELLLYRDVALLRTLSLPNIPSAFVG
jgi:Domain of unknown function (DUF4440)